jgi:hypothetical protein
MKYKPSVLRAVLSLGAIVVSGWLNWSTSANAQLTASPPTYQPRYQPSQVLPPLPVSPQYQVPPPPVGSYTDPTTTYYGLPLKPGNYSVHIAEADPGIAKLVIAYQEKQGELDKILKQLGDANESSAQSELRKQLVEVTAAQFDLQQQQRERQIELLKERLEAVETTVANRSKLKDEIVEKRVADILREPDQLQWEPLSMATAPNGAAILPPSYGTTPAPPAKTYVPRIVTRIHRETTVDEKGNKQIVDRPVQETVYDEVEPVRIVPIPDDSASTHLAGAGESASAFLSQQQLAPTILSVAEAKARVRIAESKLDNMIRRSYKGDVDASMEVKTLTAELELTKVVLAQAEAEYEGRTKLLELEVRRQESAFGLASAVLAETQEINKRSPKAIPPTQVATQEAAVDQARIELERTNTLLEFHQKSNATQEKLPGAEPNDK